MASAEDRGHSLDHKLLDVSCAWCGVTATASEGLLAGWSGWSVRHPKDVITVERRKIPRYCPRCAKGMPPIVAR